MSAGGLPAGIEAAVLAMPMARELGVRFVRVEAGTVELEIPFDERWTFRPGQYQATPVFAVADFAAVCAAGSLLGPGWTVSTVDVTLKLLEPALEGPLRAMGRVLRGGRFLTVAAADVFSASATGERLCATALVTARNIAPPS